MARQISGKKPKNFGFTLRALLSYMGRHKFLFLVVAVLVTVSAMGNLLGTYMIRPVVNSVGQGDMAALVQGVAVTAGIYGVGGVAAPPHTQPQGRPLQNCQVPLHHPGAALAVQGDIAIQQHHFHSVLL